MRDRARSLHLCMCISDDALIWHGGPSFGEFSHVLITQTGWISYDHIDNKGTSRILPKLTVSPCPLAQHGALAVCSS